MPQLWLLHICESSLESKRYELLFLFRRQFALLKLIDDFLGIFLRRFNFGSIAIFLSLGYLFDSGTIFFDKVFVTLLQEVSAIVPARATAAIASINVFFMSNVNLDY